MLEPPAEVAAKLRPPVVVLYQAEGMCLIDGFEGGQPLASSTKDLLVLPLRVPQRRTLFGSGYGAVSQGTPTRSWPHPSLLLGPSPCCRGSGLYSRGAHPQHLTTSPSGSSFWSWLCPCFG